MPGFCATLDTFRKPELGVSVCWLPQRHLQLHLVAGFSHSPDAAHLLLLRTKRDRNDIGGALALSLALSVHFLIESLQRALSY